MAVRCAEAGADSVGLSDTVGYANPAQVSACSRASSPSWATRRAARTCTTRAARAWPNVVAALDAGVTTFDASQGGIGGCPYAPGASGNIVTEDLVFLLESMGLDTGIDMAKLIEARAIFAEGLPGEPIYGHVPDAGLPKNFRRAAEPA
jgi:hydroxymethylglutaryl-CoA lyase